MSSLNLCCCYLAASFIIVDCIFIDWNNKSCLWYISGICYTLQIQNVKMLLLLQLMHLQNNKNPCCKWNFVYCGLYVSSVKSSWVIDLKYVCLFQYHSEWLSFVLVNTEVPKTFLTFISKEVEKEGQFILFD